MSDGILTRSKHPKSINSQYGKALSLYPLVWLGTTIVISIALHFVFGGMQ